MSETHSTTENNNSHCCDNTCGNADDRVVPDSVEINPLFARPKEAQAFSKFTIPQKGSLPETAYQVVHDEAMLDGNARLNLATFVSTWMDDHANRLYMEAADKNMIDKDEYPKTAEVESRCWHMLADLWHAPDPMNAIGTSTIGSSEACMLGGLALKRRWKEAREKADLPTDRPNLVMSSAVRCAGRSSATISTWNHAMCRFPRTTKCSTAMISTSMSMRTPSAWWPSWA